MFFLLVFDTTNTLQDWIRKKYEVLRHGIGIARPFYFPLLPSFYAESRRFFKLDQIGMFDKVLGLLTLVGHSSDLFRRW